MQKWKLLCYTGLLLLQDKCSQVPLVTFQVLGRIWCLEETVISKLISGNLSSHEVWGSVELLQPEKQWLHQFLLPSALSRDKNP